MTDRTTALEALSRIGANLRVDAFNGIQAGKPDFAAMIVRDDEPGCASILAQQMTDAMADDFITVIEFARTMIATPVADEGVTALVEQLEAWSDQDGEYGHHARSQTIAKAATILEQQAARLSSANPARLLALEEALRPFADLADEAIISASALQNDRDDFIVSQIGGYQVGELQTDDFRRAAATLTGKDAS